MPATYARPRMELRHLRYFIGVAEEENISRAALRLHVSQPALSRQIRDLEDELGFALLVRTAKSVRLTEAGRVFLREAREVMQRMELGVKNARAASEGKQEIHVGYAPSLTTQILPKALRALQKDVPGARVILHDLSTEEMLAGLRDGSLHVALLARPGRAMLRGLESVELARYPLCLAVPAGHSLARRRSVSIEQAAGQPLIGYSQADYPEYHEALEEIFSSCKKKLRLTEQHDSVTSLIAAVEAGRGAALAPSCLSCMVGSRLKLLPLSPAPPAVVVMAVWRRESLPPVAGSFLNAVRG